MKWPVDSKKAMAELCALFPALEDVPGTNPWDQMKVLSWLAEVGASHGERCAAIFVLSVWNSGTDWSEMAKENGLDHENVPRFDLFEAMGVWDNQNHSAFLAWAQNPFWP
jgi:hypothetical protein